MLAVNYSTFRKKLKEYCDKATTENETVIITRKDEKNVVLMSLQEWNELSKSAKNTEYLNMLNRSFDQLHAGKGHKHELINDV